MPDCLFVAYYASAELTCYLARGWPFPSRILDLHTEFRCVTSGLPVPCGHGLLGALAYYGLDSLSVVEKDEMRQLVMRGGPYTPAEQTALLAYCQTDVDALAQLLPAMLPHLDLPHALLRGRYMAAAARIEWTGIPVDTTALARLQVHWDTLRYQLALAVNRDYPVFLPHGQRVIDATTPLGAALLRTAAAWGLDPYQLAGAVDLLWREEQERSAETRQARRQARARSGLTPAGIDRWERAGYDHRQAADLVRQGTIETWDGSPLTFSTTRFNSTCGTEGSPGPAWPVAPWPWMTRRSWTWQKSIPRLLTLSARCAPCSPNCAGWIWPSGRTAGTAVSLEPLAVRRAAISPERASTSLVRRAGCVV
jgi:hypothetical protein